MKIQTYLLAWAAAFAIIAMTALLADSSPQKDELGYIEIAWDLSERDTFTDGSFAPLEQKGQPGRFFAPAYPYLIHLVSRLDRRLAEAVACHGKNPKATPGACPGSFVSLVLVQSALMAAAGLCVFIIAFALTRSQVAAWLALGLTLAASEIRGLAGLMLSESVSLPAFAGFIAAAVLWSERRGAWGLAALAGALLGIATLARPGYLYLYYAVIGCLAVWVVAQRRRDGSGRIASGIAFALAGAAVITPWMARNLLAFGDGALTSGYAGFTLAQRVAYNAMTWNEWLISWLYWLPDFGDNVAKSVFGKEAVARLGWTDASSFYKTGLGPLYAETLKAAGSTEAHLRFLLREYVLGDLCKHVLVTLPLTMRGIWAGGYVALAGMLLAPWFMRRSIAEGRTASVLVLAVPLFFMAGLHGFVSVNIVRYNEAMIALWSTIVAWAVVERVAKRE